MASFMCTQHHNIHCIEITHVLLFQFSRTCSPHALICSGLILELWNPKMRRSGLSALWDFLEFAPQTPEHIDQWPMDFTDFQPANMKADYFVLLISC